MVEQQSGSAVDVRREVLVAEERIRRHIRETLLEPSPWLSETSGCEVWLKLESLQRSGSFKFRGAANKLLSLSQEERRRGVVTASTGNHGTAVALLLRELGLPGTIFVPESASQTKIDAMRRLGADLHVHGSDGRQTELFARHAAEETGRIYVSPYNDAKIVGGQGTIGIELERQLGRFDSLFVPVGGGGLLSGVAGYLKAIQPELQVVACQPHNSRVMYESLRAGEILDLDSLSTLADGTAGGIEPGALTFPLCRHLIDDFVLLEEQEIRSAIRQLIAHHHLLVEGAAALAVAALLKEPIRRPGRKVVLILTGSRIGLESLRAVLA